MNRMFEPSMRAIKPGQKTQWSELAIVYAVLKEHKGFIDVLALPERGGFQ